MINGQLRWSDPLEVNLFNEKNLKDVLFKVKKSCLFENDIAFVREL